MQGTHPEPTLDDPPRSRRLRVLAPGIGLAVVERNSMDFAYPWRILQHMPTVLSSRDTAEFVRVIEADTGVVERVFQRCASDWIYELRPGPQPWSWSAMLSTCGCTEGWIGMACWAGESWWPTSRRGGRMVGGEPSA